MEKVISFAGDDTHVLALAAGLQQGSSHPLALAVLAAAQAKFIEPAAMTDSRALAGRGVMAQHDGRHYSLGNRRLLLDLGWQDSELDQHQRTAGADGYTLSWLARSGDDGKQLLGLLLFRDTLRPTAKAAVSRLHQLGIRTLMLSGDNRASAELIARDIGLDDVRADILPEHKADAIHALQQQGEKVAMVGDGINDAPALMSALRWAAAQMWRCRPPASR
jgi:Cu+-exporting ATPase